MLRREWLLECDLACSSMLLPDVPVPSSQVQEFSCRGQTVKYMCKCEGDACPRSYCASSQCQPDGSAGFSCDLPCSPQENHVQCPEGKIPRYIKSFPLCPEHTPRYACKHFDRCESGEGQRLSLPADFSAPAPAAFASVGARREKKNAAGLAAPARVAFVLPVVVFLAARR